MKNYFKKKILDKWFTLNLRDGVLTQDFINRIGESTKLETLYITYFADSADLDFSPLNKIKTLNTLYTRTL